MVDSSSDNMLLSGGTSHAKSLRALRAGPLSLWYGEGAIRYVRVNGYEAVRRIYSAVRDHNWDTIEPQIVSERITMDDRSFLIEVKAAYIQGDLEFEADYRISGSAEGVIRCEMNGCALTSFRKNRIGFCVLHPVHECAGNRCEVTHPDGTVTKGVFPKRISAHQPFKDIREIRWELPDASAFRMTFEGDVFEMEDQRNWTDASYKTYCTPLEIPFPVQVQKGEIIRQVIEFFPEHLNPKSLHGGEGETNAVLTIFPEVKSPLPRIGIARSSEVAALSERDMQLIRQAGFSHYRIDAKLFEPDWQPSLAAGCREAVALNLPLEIALHIPASMDERLLAAFAGSACFAGVCVAAILILQEAQKATPSASLRVALPILRRRFPSAEIGAGTDAYFTELNRNRVDTDGLDFISFSINPQVHAFDNASLTETLEAQGECVRSALAFAGGKGVRVGPVTLKPRFNPNATGPEPIPLPGQLPSQVDMRQRSLYAAGWTAGSIKFLAQAGADSITFFETAGRRGLFMPEFASEPDPIFGAQAGEVFPVYQVFREILACGGAVVKSESSAPLMFDGCAVRNDTSLHVVLMNFQAYLVRVNIPAVSEGAGYKLMDADAVSKERWWENFSMAPYRSADVASGMVSVTLPPYATAIVRLNA